jgi:hypothetical protein
MTAHAIYRVTGFRGVAPHTLEVHFQDGTSQVIDFFPVLRGALFGPLRNPVVFDQVQLDEEGGLLVWPNGADFDPETLHDWPKYREALAAMAATWREAEVSS